MSGDLPVLGHVTVAFLLTYLLGFERQLRGSAAGDRTFALIGTGSALVGVLSQASAPNALAGAITGVGFIGAGLVFRQTLGSAHRQIVRGLTSAAGIFAAAAIGAAAGQGKLALATLGTLLSLLSLEVRYLPGLNLFDAGRWAYRFKNDDPEPEPDSDPAEKTHTQ
ncbi:MAG TPA: MgtC/SapB family protein [Actinocrinis sp.]|nr:MgtC/SapB family protein [Actinocrinis sp.]